MAAAGATFMGDNVASNDNTVGYHYISSHGSFGGRLIDMQYTQGILFHVTDEAAVADAAYSGHEAMRLTNDGILWIDGLIPYAASTGTVGTSAVPYAEIHADDIYTDTLHAASASIILGGITLTDVGGDLISDSPIIAPSGSDPSALVTNQVLIDERGAYGLGHDHDSRYYTQALLDGGQLDGLYYTQTAADLAFAPLSHNNTNHSDTYITAAGVTYGNLDGAGDIGTGSDQVSQGDHSHAYSAITGTHGNEDHSSTFIADVVTDTTPQLGGDLDLNTKCIDYGAILTVNGQYEGTKITVDVDDASAAYGLVLAQAADFSYDRADADASTQSVGLVMALESGTGSKEVLIEGQICATAWDWDAGLLYLSGTTGGMTQTAPAGPGDQVVVVGWALSADTIYFKPSLVLVEIA